ncbi:TasA family protein [Alkalihalobacterium sp. APHAB7]|uniref:TasA family protein n=1 Tax=Alkalihalobacterium sp. APHAB7 TaxID=3402081 RepID=UPI003AADBF75
MSVKKKIGVGVLTGMLGLSLVGGGTWAAFNDTATINNHFAAGVLDLEVIPNHPSHKMNFDLRNMKPGDNVQRIFKLNNGGTIAIKEVLLNVTADNFEFEEGYNNDMLAFLDQFVIDFMNVDTENPQWQPRGNVVKSGQELTLGDLVRGGEALMDKIDSKYHATDGTPRINLVPLQLPTNGDQARRGLPVEPQDTDAVFTQITFKDDRTRVGGDYSEFVQNMFQTNGVDFFFNLEATQWNGYHIDTPNGNGEVNNQIAPNATDRHGNPIADPKTRGTGKYDGNIVIDEQNNGGFGSED